VMCDHYTTQVCITKSSNEMRTKDDDHPTKRGSQKQRTEQIIALVRACWAAG
jgi:hypothetical protein